MGHDPNREPPFFFMKPADALLLVPAGETVELPYPPQTTDYHFEIEMVAALGKGGRDIPVETALDCVWGYAVGLDMTRRDLQDEAKRPGPPLGPRQGGRSSRPVGPLHPVAQIGHPARARSRSASMASVKQKATSPSMIWSVAEQVSYLSAYFELKPGDVISPARPRASARSQRGQTMVGAIEGLGEIRLRVA